MNPEFRPEYLAFLLPIILAIALEKGPPFLREWWKNIVAKQWKPTVLFIGSILIVLIIRGLACVHVNIGLGATCDNPADPQLWVNTLGIGIAIWLLMETTYRLNDAANQLTSTSDLNLNVAKMTGPTYISPAGASPVPSQAPLAGFPILNGLNLDALTDDEIKELSHRLSNIMINRQELGPIRD